MEKIIVYTSGGALGNPGPAAAGVYIEDEKGVLIQEVKQSLGNANENFAEYFGVMLALQTLVQLYGDDTKNMEFEFRIDSEFVKKQLNSEESINEPGLVPMFIEIHNMQVASFPDLTFSQIKPEKNKKAKRLVKESLDS